MVAGLSGTMVVFDPRIPNDDLQKKRCCSVTVIEHQPSTIIASFTDDVKNMRKEHYHK